MTGQELCPPRETPRSVRMYEVDVTLGFTRETLAARTGFRCALLLAAEKCRHEVPTV